MGGFLGRENNQNVYFLSINSQGNLYESSPTPKPGFVSHMNEKTRSVNYWREYPYGIQGYITNVGIIDRQMDGMTIKQFSITVDDFDGGNRFYIQRNLNTQSGDVDRYVKSFVKYYKNLDFTKEYNIDSFKRRPSDKYAPSNFMFAIPTEDGRATLVDMYYKKGQNGWVEGVDTVTYDGNNKKDYTQQNKFVYDIIKQILDDMPKTRQARMDAIKRDREARGLPFYEASKMTAYGNSDHFNKEDPGIPQQDMQQQPYTGQPIQPRQQAYNQQYMQPQNPQQGGAYGNQYQHPSQQYGGQTQQPYAPQPQMQQYGGQPQQPYTPQPAVQPQPAPQPQMQQQYGGQPAYQQQPAPQPQPAPDASQTDDLPF